MFEGYLIKILGSTDYVLPLKYIDYGSYACAIHGQDKEAFTNANGITKRFALKNKKPKCEFSTVNGITQSHLYEILQNIQVRYTNVDEKKVRAKIWSAEINGYITHDWYVPDIEPVISEIDLKNNELVYEPVRLAFISYGGIV